MKIILFTIAVLAMCGMYDIWVEAYTEYLERKQTEEGSEKLGKTTKTNSRVFSTYDRWGQNIIHIRK
jgi:hypothetical protein